jgi:hypothetical protein
MLNFEFDWPTNHKNVRIRFNAKDLSCEWIVDENIIFLLKFTEQHKKRKLLFMPDNLKTLKVYKNTIILNGDSFNLFLYFNKIMRTSTRQEL